jgi:LAS superfamily LD-carboxypeptidase LdcB
VLTSAYRSAARQAALAADAVTKYGNKEAATWVAQGRSEHITGRAFDLYLGIDNTGENAKAGKFNGLSAFIWLKANAADFGLNAYNIEPWHWSYNVSP